MPRRRTENIYWVGSTKYCYTNPKYLHKAWHIQNGKFSLPLLEQFGQTQKCGSLVQKKFTVVMDSDVFLAIHGCGQENLQISQYKVVSKLVHEINQQSLLTYIQIHDFVGQHLKGGTYNFSQFPIIALIEIITRLRKRRKFLIFTHDTMQPQIQQQEYFLT